MNENARRPEVDLHEFVLDLIERYGRLRAAGGQTFEIDERLTELRLAECALRLLRVAGATSWPRQVAVIGPTQTGKSTIANLLLGLRAADVSPLAGYTVHPQGFWIEPPAKTSKRQKPAEPSLFDALDEPLEPSADAGLDRGWASELFPGWRRCVPAELPRDDMRCYALEIAPRERMQNVPAALPTCVVWDTPDFDSLAAKEYQDGLLSVASAADAFVVVLSKEKYSDLAAWRMLTLLAPLKRPLVLCLNKLTPDAADAVTQALRARLREHGDDFARVAVVGVQYDPAISEHEAQHAQSAKALRWEVGECLSRTGRKGRATGVRALLLQGWESWTAPIAVEHAALGAWDQVVAVALASLLTAYRRDYLDHPQRYDSFQRATVELLQLLEIPGIGGALADVRRVVTWPARFLWRQGRKLTQRAAAGDEPQMASEETFLRSEFDTLLAMLQRDAARQATRCGPQAAVWRAIERRLLDEHERLLATFRAAAKEHHDHVEAEIHTTAGRLYESLKERPALLNTLRAARATADAAAVALALKTGGVGPQDLLFAPAMLGITSLLTEGALGSYMQRLASELKERQYEHLRQEFGGGVFRAELLLLTEKLDDESLFGVSPQQLQLARDVLNTWEP